MIIGEEKIHENVKKILADINENEETRGELVEIDEVFIIAAVHYGPSNNIEDAEEGQLYFRSSSAKPHVQYGLIRQAENAITVSIHRL